MTDTDPKEVLKASEQASGLTRTVKLIAAGNARRQEPGGDVDIIITNARRVGLLRERLAMSADDYIVMADKLQLYVDLLVIAEKALLFIADMTITVNGVDQKEPFSAGEAIAALRQMEKRRGQSTGD